jgi:hypothetical protein
MATKTVTYVPTPQGTLNESDNRLYLQRELSGISQSIKSLVAEVERINARLASHGIP